MKKFISIAMILALMLSVMAIVPASAAKTDNAEIGEGNDFLSAYNYTFGEKASGTLIASDLCDYYKFTLPTSGKINLNVTAFIKYTEYYLYDANYNRLWSSLYNTWDSVTHVTVKTEEFYLTSGTYYLLIDCYSSSGSYNMSMSYVSSNESFKETQGGSNNSFVTAENIAVNKLYKGQFALNDSEDFYQFTLPSSGKVNLTLNSHLWHYYKINDSDFNSIISENNMYAEQVGNLHKENKDFYLTSGTYYFIVNTANKDYQGNYEFTLTFTDAKESFKETSGGVNNSFETASAVSLNKTYNGQLAHNDDSDFYKFTVSGKKNINLTITSYQKYCDYTIHNSSFSKIWDSDYKWNDTSNVHTLNEIIELSSGTYYLVSTKNNRDYLGNYSFTIKDASIPSSIKLNRSSATLYLNKTYKLSAIISPSTATKTVKWTSSDPSVVSVSNGTITAKKVGSATITAATVNGLTATCKVSVVLTTPKITKFENTASGIKMTWGKVSGAAKYRVFVKTSKGWTKLVDTTATSYTYKKAKSGTKYTFTVRCMNAKATAATSSFSSAGWKTTFVAAPALPTLKNTKNGVQISWKKPAGAVKYRIFRKTGNGKWAKLADTTALKYVDKSAKKGVTYSYTIRCISSNGKTYTSAYNTTGRKIKCVR